MTKTFTLATLVLSCVSFLTQAQTDNQTLFPKETLPPTVNSPFVDARPLISGNGQQLFFVRRQHPNNFEGVRDNQDIYLSTYDSTTNTWSEAEHMGRALNNRLRNAVASVNEDGTELILFNTYTRSKTEPLVRTTRTAKGGWSPVKPIAIENFVNVNDYADYHLDFRNNVLFLAIEGDVTQGQQDIYVSFRNGFGNWKEPVNLGPIINTPQSEFAPFLGSDGRSLFFCSFGHEGLGSSDIYMSVRLDDTWLRWSTPVNLGPAINTAQEESYFSITDDFQYLYYTSHTTRDTNREIVRVELPEDFTAINGPVLVRLDSAAISNIMLSGNYDVNQTGARRNFQGIAFEGWPNEEQTATQTPQTPAATDTTQIAGTGTATDTTTAATTTPTTGTGTATAPEGESDRYAGFQPVEQASNLSPEAEELKNYLQQRLPDLNFLVRQEGDAIEFKIVQNLEYDFNSIYVASEYLPRLRTIGNILKDRPQLEVELVGHTDEVGSAEANERVARQRVENLKNYFQRRGIAQDRIEIIGVGNSEPLAPGNTAEDRLKNRRVETIVRMNR